VEAIQKKDYEGISKCYVRLCQLFDDEKKQILDKIRTLPRQNKDEDIEQFLNAFVIRTSVTMPEWHWLTSQVREHGVIEGEVFGSAAAATRW